MRRTLALAAGPALAACALFTLARPAGGSVRVAGFAGARRGGGGRVGETERIREG